MKWYLLRLYINIYAWRGLFRKALSAQAFKTFVLQIYSWSKLTCSYSFLKVTIFIELWVIRFLKRIKLLNCVTYPHSIFLENFLYVGMHVFFFGISRGICFACKLAFNIKICEMKRCGSITNCGIYSIDVIVDSYHFQNFNSFPF